MNRLSEKGRLNCVKLFTTDFRFIKFMCAKNYRSIAFSLYKGEINKQKNNNYISFPIDVTTLTTLNCSTTKTTHILFYECVYLCIISVIHDVSK